jgi:hypothetical protein
VVSKFILHKVYIHYKVNRKLQTWFLWSFWPYLPLLLSFKSSLQIYASKPCTFFPTNLFTGFFVFLRVLIQKYLLFEVFFTWLKHYTYTHSHKISHIHNHHTHSHTHIITHTHTHFIYTNPHLPYPLLASLWILYYLI